MSEVFIFRPPGVCIRGPLRPVSVRVGDQWLDDVVRAPAWWAGLAFNPMRLRTTLNGLPALLREFRVEWGLRKTVREAESIYRRSFVVAFEFPVRLRWWANHCPSRAWTGRERELHSIDYWTPRGWKCRVLRRS